MSGAEHPPKNDPADPATLPSTAAGDTQDDWVTVGEVIGVFGIQGALKVRPYTDIPDRFEHTRTVYLGESHLPYDVQSAREHKHMIILTLAGVADPNAAERLHGQRIAIPAREITPLPPDQFYLHDVIGLRVQNVQGRLLGTVRDIYSTGASDIYVVRTPDDERDVLLPAVKSFVKSIDLAAGIIQVDPIPGLFDEEADEAR